MQINASCKARRRQSARASEQLYLWHESNLVQHIATHVSSARKHPARRVRASKNNTTHEPAIVAARRAAQSGIGRRRRAGLSPARLVGARTTPTRRRCLWTSSTARPTALRLRRRPGRVDLPQRKGRRSPSGHHALEQGAATRRDGRSDEGRQTPGRTTGLMREIISVARSQ